MEAVIGIDAEDQPGEITALAAWLEADRDFAGRVNIVLEQGGKQALGGAFELLSVALGSGGMGAALAQSLTAWLASRRSDVKLTVTADDRTVRLDAHRVADAEALISQVLGEDDAG